MGQNQRGEKKEERRVVFKHHTNTDGTRFFAVSWQRGNRGNLVSSPSSAMAARHDPILLALALDREHELVSLVDQVGGRREDGVGPGKRGES